MPKGLYIGDGTSKKVKRVYFGESAVSRKVKKGYIGVDGAAKLFFSGATVWKKYNLITTTTYTWRQYNYSYDYQLVSGSSTTRDISIGTSAYSSISVDSRGRIALSNPTMMDVYNMGDFVGYYVDDPVQRLTSWIGDTAEFDYRYRVTNMSAQEVINKTYIGTVQSTDAGAYPADGIQNGYYYDSRTADTQYSQGTYVEDIEADDPNTYPDNGRHSDGYWYVKQDE